MRRRALRGGGLLAALGASALYVERDSIAGLFPHEAHVDLFSLGVAFSSVPDSLASEVQAHGPASVLHAGCIPGVDRTFVQPDSPPIIAGTRTLSTAHGAEAPTALPRALLGTASRPGRPQPQPEPRSLRAPRSFHPHVGASLPHRGAQPQLALHVAARYGPRDRGPRRARLRRLVAGPPRAPRTHPAP